MKVWVELADASYYPDVFPTGSREKRFKRNSILVIEVLSDSTAAFNRGTKFAHYRQLDSLREYVLIEPERPSVVSFRRNTEGGWVLHPVAEGGSWCLPPSISVAHRLLSTEDVALG